MKPLSFTGRTLVLATMHGKESVILPPLEARLGVRGVVAPGLNTDQFGTFTGEIPREGSPLEAARRKVLAALDATGARLGVASEGSFGPHPAIPFLAADVELLLLVDRTTGWKSWRRKSRPTPTTAARRAGRWTKWRCLPSGPCFHPTP
jgi:hypothetical protein